MPSIDSVWLLQHVHEFADGSEDVKLIGVFASRQEAEEVQAKVASQPGFREMPEGFSITEHQLGVVGWSEGFVTVEPLRVGMQVRILTVDSCTKELPVEDQDRLRALVGKKREIIEIDDFGFVWLSFDATQRTADFCLLPVEVANE